MGQTEWREFEKVVADLERTLIGEGMTVESPARLTDKDTGSPREVDVLVSVPYGHETLQVMIECRHRGDTQDVRWIEELASKRDSVGVNHVIAVSRSGFSNPARAKARALGVETRTLTELSTEAVREAVYLSSFHFQRNDFGTTHVNVDCGPLLREGEESPPHLAQLKQRLEAGDPTIEFYDTDSRQRLTFMDLVARAIPDELKQSLSPGEEPLPFSRSVRDDRIPPSIVVLGSNPPVYVWGYEVSARLSATRVELRPAAFREYTSDDGLLMRQLEYDLEPAGEHGRMLIDLYPPLANGSIPFRPRLHFEGSGPPPRLTLTHLWEPGTSGSLSVEQRFRPDTRGQ